MSTPALWRGLGKGLELLPGSSYTGCNSVTRSHQYLSTARRGRAARCPRASAWFPRAAGHRGPLRSASFGPLDVGYEMGGRMESKDGAVPRVGFRGSGLENNPHIVEWILDKAIRASYTG